MIPAAGAAIEVANLSKHFGDQVALERISFAVGRGEIFGVVGPDGAGKTTAMRLLAGVMRPDGGSVAIDGVDVVADPERAKRHISYMPQRFGLYEDLTVAENIRFFADLFGVSRKLRDERMEPLLAASNMGAFRGRLAGKLSGGMKQKLGLICSLIHAPKVVLLDEPTTGVDPVSRRDFWRILYGLREQGVTLVISTAYLDEAERCMRLALLHRGRLDYCDTPARLKALMPGHVIHVASPASREVRTLLVGMDGVRSVLLVGDGAHVVVDDAPKRIPDLRAALDRAGIAVSEIVQTEPSIEDIFVALLDHEGAAP